MKRGSSYMQYHWWMYLLWAMAVMVIWFYLFYLVAMPKRNERIEISVFDSDFPVAMLQRDISRDIGDITDQNITEVKAGAYGGLGESIHNVVVARLVTSDIIIIPESLLTTDKSETNKIRTENFRAVPVDTLDAMISELEYYTVADTAYGVYITLDDGITNNFESYLEEDERYILFFCDESPNHGGLFGIGEQSDRAGVDILKYLLEDVNG